MLYIATYNVKKKKKKLLCLNFWLGTVGCMVRYICKIWGKQKSFPQLTFILISCVYC